MAHLAIFPLSGGFPLSVLLHNFWPCMLGSWEVSPLVWNGKWGSLVAPQQHVEAFGSSRTPVQVEGPVLEARAQLTRGLLPSGSNLYSAGVFAGIGLDQESPIWVYLQWFQATLKACQVVGLARGDFP